MVPRGWSGRSAPGEPSYGSATEEYKHRKQRGTVINWLMAREQWTTWNGIQRSIRLCPASPPRINTQFSGRRRSNTFLSHVERFVGRLKCSLSLFCVSVRDRVSGVRRRKGVPGPAVWMAGAILLVMRRVLACQGRQAYTARTAAQCHCQA